MVNTTYIKASIEDNETKQYVLANQLGISEYSFCQKLRNKRKFTFEEIIKLMELLNIEFTLENVKLYFLKEE